MKASNKFPKDLLIKITKNFYLVAQAQQLILFPGTKI